MSFLQMIFLSAFLLLAGCSGNPYREISMNPEELQGSTQAWFLEYWGEPRSKVQRFFGEESWAYLRIAGGQPFPFLNDDFNECQISLNFNQQGVLKDSDYFGC